MISSTTITFLNAHLQKYPQEFFQKYNEKQFNNIRSKSSQNFIKFRTRLQLYQVVLLALY